MFHGYRYLNRRQFLSTAALTLAAPAILSIRHARAAEPVTVEIENGKLRGMLDNGTVSFKGVPYAANTGGSNRFLAPRPVANWTGVRDALQLGDRCVQERETFADTPVLAWYGQTEPFSENCCVLNVFTPGTEPNARRPVMVYIHGGGFVTGGGGGPVLDGSNLARFGDVVVVTLNHRIGLLGYTNLSQLDPEYFGDGGNAGQLDLIAALTWVKKNISAFGGDPGNVTLFGQSGGGNKIMVLMAMPEAKGLFHRAINMSGVTGLVVAPAAETQPYVNEMLKALGVDKSNPRKLQEVPVEALLKARQQAVAAAKYDGARPVVDGRHILAGPFTPQGLAVHSSVPLMIGTVDTETTFLFRTEVRNFKVTADQVKARIKGQFDMDDAQAEALMTAYRQDQPNRTPADILIAVSTDTLFRGPLIRAVETKANAKQAPVYLYNFNWKAPVDGGMWRAPHTIDIPFAFGTTDKSTVLTGTGPEPAEVARNLMAAFVAYARTGNPSSPRTPEWKPYDTATRATMVIDVKSQAVNDFRGGDRRASSELRLDPFTWFRGTLFNYKD